ncbi:coatomer subunit gamma-like isoform X1 [Durio zibethinus]|uniref:Coatomer subunit gamma-like isoform X1 n=1 Tax=Durio zibethinus TaxID=66656 RepID=A0A6P5WPQ0_DURZI|nr:coatomer subunit gamma-like isoform X1 [Durio zibethinus]
MRLKKLFNPKQPLCSFMLWHCSTRLFVSQPTTLKRGNRPFYDFHKGCLRYKAEMVIFEAARANTKLNGVTSRELTLAITVLQLFLSSSKPVLRFAAVCTLNKVAMTHPMAVTNCNIDMESLISKHRHCQTCNGSCQGCTLILIHLEVMVQLLKHICNFCSFIE